jgi:NDP-sugar pyrophosphorylase family protein
MDAVILCGGKGTRLRPYTATLPKALVPLGERPILEVVLCRLREAGVRRVILAVNHLAELLMAFFGDGRKWGLRIDYSIEEEPRGTIGPLRLIPDLPENFLVMNADVLTDLDIRELWKFHHAHRGLATVASFPRETRIDFGVLSVDAEGRLEKFAEKPVLPHLVSMGIYVFRREVLHYVPENRLFGFDHLMLTLLEARQAVYTWRHRGYWLDIGRPDDYERALNELEARSEQGRARP